MPLPYLDVHRRPGEESTDLYPGLVVSDGEHSRVTGSITIGRTRLPMWAVISGVIHRGWGFVEAEYYPDLDGESINWGEGLTREENIAACKAEYHDFDSARASEFFYNLMENRGEFGRLILLLADVERRSRYGKDWTQTKKHRKRMADQLRRCLDLVEAGE